MKRLRKRPMEFSKKLVLWALIFTTLCVITSYLLAANGLDTASEVTTVVVTSCIAIAVSYEAKSFGEKNSRNKYGVDINGRPMCQDDDEALG